MLGRERPPFNLEAETRSRAPSALGHGGVTAQAGAVVTPRGC
jgi:hypothetical protein